MGVPLAYNKALAPDVERYSAINDFMVMAAHVGVAEHLVFVEPPVRAGTKRRGAFKSCADSPRRRVAAAPRLPRG